MDTWTAIHTMTPIKIVAILCAIVFSLKIGWNLFLAYWAVWASKTAKDDQGISLMPAIEVVFLVLVSVSAHFAKFDYAPANNGWKVFGIGFSLVVLSYVHLVLVCKVYKWGRGVGERGR